MVCTAWSQWQINCSKCSHTVAYLRAQSDVPPFVWKQKFCTKAKELKNLKKGRASNWGHSGKVHPFHTIPRCYHIEPRTFGARSFHKILSTSLSSHKWEQFLALSVFAFWVIAGPSIMAKPVEAYLLAHPSWQPWWRSMLFSSIIVTSTQMSKSVDLPVCVCESVTMVRSAAVADVWPSAAAADVSCFTAVVNSAATVVVSPLFAVATHHKPHQPPLLLRIIVLSLPPSMSASSSFCSFTLTDDLEQQNDVVFEIISGICKRKK